VFVRAGLSRNYVLEQVNSCWARFFWGPKEKALRVNPFVSLVRGFFRSHCLSMAAWNSSVFDRGAGIRFSLAFETVEPPMLEKGYEHTASFIG
jgi:hypothetical protein